MTKIKTDLEICGDKRLSEISKQVLNIINSRWVSISLYYKSEYRPVYLLVLNRQLKDILRVGAVKIQSYTKTLV